MGIYIVFDCLYIYIVKEIINFYRSKFDNNIYI